jgi:lipoprotein LpqH
VKKALVGVAASAVVAGIAGCSSSTSPQPPGTLPADTAHVTVNGQSAGNMRDITCGQVGDGALGTKNSNQYVTIETGDQTTGWSAVVQSVLTPDAPGGFKLATKSVEIRNLGGFTGSYWQGLTGNADAAVTGNTYKISGTVDGFNTDQPNKRATATFEIKAAC